MVWDQRVGRNKPVYRWLTHVYPRNTFVSWKMPRCIFVCAIPHKVGLRPILLPFRIFYDTNQILHTAYLSILRALPILSSGLQIHDQPTCLFRPYLSACPPSVPDRPTQSYPLSWSHLHLTSCVSWLRYYFCSSFFKAVYLRIRHSVVTVYPGK